MLILVFSESNPATREPFWVIFLRGYYRDIFFPSYRSTLPRKYKISLPFFSPPQQYNQTQYQQPSAQGRLRSLALDVPCHYMYSLQRGVAPSADVVRCFFNKCMYISFPLHPSTSMSSRYASLGVKTTEQVQTLSKVESP